MSSNLQCPLDSVPIWLLTPYKSYRNAPICVRGSSRSSRPVFWRWGTYRVKSRPLTGKMTGVSDLSQNTPFWVVNRLSCISRTGGRREIVRVLVARRDCLHLGQCLCISFQEIGFANLMTLRTYHASSPSKTSALTNSSISSCTTTAFRPAGTGSDMYMNVS